MVEIMFARLAVAARDPKLRECCNE